MEVIRLTENDLHQMIRETVYRILKEEGEGAMMGGSGGSVVNPNCAPNGAANDSINKTFDAPPFGLKTKDQAYKRGGSISVDRLK